MPSGVRAKLDRAEVHLAALEAQIASVIEGYEASIVREPDGEGRVLFRLHDPPTIPDDMSTILGDFVHNLRAALDHLAWELVDAPNDNTMFPVLLAEPTEPRYASKLKPLLAGTTRGVDAIVRDAQPYKRGDRRSDHPLAVLHRLDIIDKHKELLPGVVAQPGVAFFWPDGMEWIPSGTEYPEGGDVVGGFTLKTANPEAQFNATFIFYVRLKPAGDEQQLPAWTLLGLDRLIREMYTYTLGEVIRPVCIAQWGDR